MRLRAVTRCREPCSVVAHTHGRQARGHTHTRTRAHTCAPLPTTHAHARTHAGTHAPPPHQRAHSTHGTHPPPARAAARCGPCPRTPRGGCWSRAGTRRQTGWPCAASAGPAARGPCRGSATAAPVKACAGVDGWGRGCCGGCTRALVRTRAHTQRARAAPAWHARPRPITMQQQQPMHAAHMLWCSWRSNASRAHDASANICACTRTHTAPRPSPPLAAHLAVV
jgi:hypothetical protein